MTKQEASQLAVLSAQVSALASQFDKHAKDLEKNTKDTTEIKESLAALTGGRKVAVWFVTFLVSIALIAATIFEALKDMRK